MNRRLLPLVSGSLLLLLGCGGTESPTDGVNGAATGEVDQASVQATFTAQPTPTEAWLPITPAVEVELRDALGNTVADATDEVTLVVGENPAGGSLSGTLTRAAIAGIATFDDLSIDEVGAGYTLSAASGTLAAVTSEAFDITPIIADAEPLTILIDASKGGGVWWFPQGDPFDASQPHQGKALADHLRSLGNEVVELGRGVEITREMLDQYDKVLQTGQGAYTASELFAYDRYMSRSDAHLILLPHFVRAGGAHPISVRIGLSMEGVLDGVMSPTGTSAITDGVGSLTYGPGSAVGPDATATIIPLGTLVDGSVVMGLVTSRPAKILFLGDLHLLELVPEPLISNIVSWLYS